MKYKVSLNGRIYEVEVEHGEAMVVDEYEAMAPKITNAIQTEAKPTQVNSTSIPSSMNTVNAPLPGNIMSIKVSLGQKVKAGDLLLIIEAMKMENEVLAPCDGVVSQLLVNKGQTVATGDALIVL